MPIYMRLPKRGFTAPNSKKHAWVNIGRLSKAIADGKLDAKSITEESLLAAGTCPAGSMMAFACSPRVKLRKMRPSTVTGASKAAVEAVEKAGGKVTVTGVSEGKAE